MVTSPGRPHGLGFYAGDCTVNLELVLRRMGSTGFESQVDSLGRPNRPIIKQVIESSCKDTLGDLLLTNGIYCERPGGSLGLHGVKDLATTYHRWRHVNKMDVHRCPLPVAATPSNIAEFL